VSFWSAFWAVVPPIGLLALAFVQFYRRDLNQRLSNNRQQS
jgi:hypothetical protein